METTFSGISGKIPSFQAVSCNSDIKRQLTFEKKNFKTKMVAVKIIKM